MIYSTNFAAVLFALLLTANAAAQAPAAPPPAQEPAKRAGDDESRRSTGGTAFEGSDASARQIQQESERGAASRSSISGPGTHQVPRSDAFSGMSGRTGRSGAPMGGGGRR